MSLRSKNSKRPLLFVGRPTWHVTRWILPSHPIEDPWTSRHGWTASEVRGPRRVVLRRLSGRCVVADQFSTLCTVRADTTKLAKSLSPKRSGDGSVYYALEIKVILLFGLTELGAQVSWMENVSVFYASWGRSFDSRLWVVQLEGY